MLIIFNKNTGAILEKASVNSNEPLGPSTDFFKPLMIDKYKLNEEDYGEYRLHDVEDSEQVKRIIRAKNISFVLDNDKNVLSVNITDPTTDEENANYLIVHRVETKDRLDKVCKNLIIAGFISNANGVDVMYSFNEVDQINLNATANEIIFDNSITSVDVKTVSLGVISITVEQFKQLYKDANTHKNNHLSKCRELKSQIDESTDIEFISDATLIPMQ